MRLPKDPGERPFATVRALATMVQANDDRAVRYVLAQLRAAGGNVTATAQAIGCGVRSLYVWRDSNTRLREGFEKLALGRPGAGINATEARLAKREPRPKKTRKTIPLG